MPAIGIMLGLATAGQGGAYSPAVVPNLLDWSDSADATSVTLNVADVASITDKSGNSRTATQITAAEQPAYNTSTGINSKNVIAFTGANNDALALSGSLGLLRNRAGATFAGVVRIPTLGSAQRLLTVLTSGGGTLFAFGINSSNQLASFTRRVPADSSDNKVSTATISAATAHFVALTVDYATGTTVLYLDGTTRSQTAAWVTGAASDDANHSAAPLIGRQATNILTGDLAEWLIYGRALSAQEISDLRNLYLKPKWATP